MKRLMRAFVVLTWFFAATTLSRSFPVEISFPPETVRVLASEIKQLERPPYDRFSGGWRWDTSWPNEYMRSTDLALSPKGELWFAWVKHHGERGKEGYRASLFLDTPTKRVCLREDYDRVITYPALAFGGLDGAVLIWTEVSKSAVFTKEAASFLAAVSADGKLIWGPLLVDEGIGEAAIALDGEGVSHIVARPGGPWEPTAYSLPQPQLYYTVDRQGALIQKSTLGANAEGYALTMTCDAKDHEYFTWMHGVRRVAQITQTPEGPKLAEAEKMVGTLELEKAFRRELVLRAKAFFDEAGTLLVDNLLWSPKDQRWKVIRVEHKPKNPVPGNPTPTIFVDPEGGLHINP